MMTHEERQQLRNKLETDNWKTRADMYERQHRRESVTHEAVGATMVMNAGQRQVRESYEQNRPTLDPATQALWDDWFKRSFWQLMNDEVAVTMGEITGGIELELRKEMNKAVADVRKEFSDEIVRLKKDFTARILKMRKETGTRGTNVIDLPNPLKSRKT
jgi:hypothetical protein